MATSTNVGGCRYSVITLVYMLVSVFFIIIIAELCQTNLNPDVTGSMLFDTSVDVG